MVWFKKNDGEKEPQYYQSATGIPTYNYRVYYMSTVEKILYFLAAAVVGGFVGYMFYGGIGKDQFGRPTTLTIILDIVITLVVAVAAGMLFLPIRTKSIIESNKRKLNKQFRDMLDSLTTSLGAGKNVPDSFYSVYEDMKVQYEEDAYIIQELVVILSGLQNNVDLEDLIYDLGMRSDNKDIRSFADVFKISYRKGGNIKDVIRSTHEILSDKMSIAEEIETMITSNKTEQNIMVFMPVLLVGAIKLMSPDMASNFVTGAGIFSTTFAIILFVVAYLVGKSVMDIKL